jgi:3-oxoacyl-[acyl-carrier protein] reductase
MNLQNTVALVTGGSAGIGRAIAQTLAAGGARVAITGRNQRRLSETAKALGVLPIQADVASEADVERTYREVQKEFGDLDILVNNAGFGVFKPISEMTVEEWRRQIDVNLGGVFFCSKAALPHLSATGDGFIINIGSLAGRNPFARGTGYNASKAGLVAMTEAMMLDVRYDDVRVSIIMPGSVNTHFGGRDEGPGRSWPLEADDVALAVMQLLEFPKEAHVSRVEMRPSQPKRG